MLGAGLRLVGLARKERRRLRFEVKVDILVGRCGWCLSDVGEPTVLKALLGCQSGAGRKKIMVRKLLAFI